MMKMNLRHIVIGGAAALTVAAGIAATVALTPAIANAQSGQPLFETVAQAAAGAGFERRGHRGDNVDHDALLATALGISVDQLNTAQDAARTKAIAQAVADGTITQEQADRMLSGEGRAAGIMKRNHRNVDGEALLAAELGISEEALAAAQESAHQAAIDQAIADGDITQEQADLMAARKALEEYIDHKAILAGLLGVPVEQLEGADLRALIEESGKTRTEVMEAMQAAKDQALVQAVADGVITQEQADQLQNFDGHGGMRGSRGNHGPRGDRDGRSSPPNRDDSSTPDDSNFGAPDALPAVDSTI